MITIFKSMDSNSFHEYYELPEVLDRIRRGVNRSLIDQIRIEPDKNRRDQLKKQLLWICFSGKFSARNNAGMIEHSGLICLDFDGMDKRAMKQWRGEIEADKHTVSCFTSPSGNGLKVIWKIPVCKTNDEHNARFMAIAEYWRNCQYFDLNVKGWSRVCFESYDPGIYINYEADEFTGISDVTTEPVTPVSRQAAPRPTASPEYTQEYIDLVFRNIKVWFEKGFTLTEGGRNNNANVFAKAIADYLPEHIGFDRAVDYIMSNVHQGANPFTRHECEQAVRSGFKSIPVPTKQFDLPSYDEPSPNRVDFLMQPEPEEVAPDGDDSFWSYSRRGALQVDYFALKKFLQKNGFFKYRFHPDDISFIRVQGSIVSVVTVDMIRDFILQTLIEWDQREVYNLVAGDSKFKKEYVAFLDEKRPKFIRDTKDVSWVFYRNCAVRVTSNAVECVPYIDMTGYIWESEKLDREFMPTDNAGDFGQFLLNISCKNPSRYRALCSGIGYELHRFKSPSTSKVLVANDETMSDEPQGGTGKTLIFIGISKIRPTVFIDGKNFNSGKNFVWQRVSPDTNNVVIDDIPKGFKFEELFSIITTGWPIEKKNKGEIFLAPEDSPKIGIPTNNTLKGSSVSHERRKFEVEIYPHYNENYQPIDDFGKHFWSDWDDEEWNQFDNLMVRCIKLFLAEGFIKTDFVNLKIKKLISDTSTEFVEWANENIRNNSRYHRNETYKKFIDENPGTWCKSANMFYGWLREYARFHGWSSEDGGSGKMYVVIGDGLHDDDGERLPF